MFIYLLTYLLSIREEAKMKTLNITFEDKDFNKLENLKEANRILGQNFSWASFLLKLAKIKK